MSNTFLKSNGCFNSHNTYQCATSPAGPTGTVKWVVKIENRTFVTSVAVTRHTKPFACGLTNNATSCRKGINPEKKKKTDDSTGQRCIAERLEERSDRQTDRPDCCDFYHQNKGNTHLRDTLPLLIKNIDS